MKRFLDCDYAEDVEFSSLSTASAQGRTLDLLHYQAKALENLLRLNRSLIETLEQLREVGLPDSYLGGGAIAQTAWNYCHGFELTHGIRDYDIGYFEPKDLSEQAEKRAEQSLLKRLEGSPVCVDVKNQARVHLWYEAKFGCQIEPYPSARAAIRSFTTTATAVGVRLEADHTISIYAPLGLTDLLRSILRPNKVLVTRTHYEQLCRRWSQIWPKLKVVTWEETE